MKLIIYICTALIVAATHAEAKGAKAKKPWKGSGGNGGGDVGGGGEVQPPEITTWYCNKGWGGDGRCDATAGVYTFCV